MIIIFFNQPFLLVATRKTKKKNVLYHFTICRNVANVVVVVAVVANVVDVVVVVVVKLLPSYL